jgi:hypothetical protein
VKTWLDGKNGVHDNGPNRTGPGWARTLRCPRAATTPA